MTSIEVTEADRTAAMHIVNVIVTADPRNGTCTGYPRPHGDIEPLVARAIAQARVLGYEAGRASIAST